MYPTLKSNYKYFDEANIVLNSISFNQNNIIGYNHMLYNRVRKLAAKLAETKLGSVLREFKIDYPKYYPNESFTNESYHLILTIVVEPISIHNLNISLKTKTFRYSIPVIAGSRPCMTYGKDPLYKFYFGERWNDKGGMISSSTGNEIIIRINEKKIILLPLSYINKKYYDAILSAAGLQDKKLKKKNNNENDDETYITNNKMKNDDDDDNDDEDEISKDKSEVSKRRGEGVKTMKAFMTEMYIYDNINRIHKIIIFMQKDIMYFFNIYPKKNGIEHIAGNIYCIFTLIFYHVNLLSSPHDQTRVTLSPDEEINKSMMVQLCNNYLKLLINPNEYAHVEINLTKTKSKFESLQNFTYKELINNLCKVEHNYDNIDINLRDLLLINNTFNFKNNCYICANEVITQKMAIVSMLISTFIRDRLNIDLNGTIGTDIDNYANKMYIPSYEKIFNDISLVLYTTMSSDKSSETSINNDICKMIVSSANKASKAEQADMSKLVQMLERETYINSVSRMRTAVINATKHVKEKARGIRLDSQIGFIDPFYTPESEKVGLRKEMAIFGWISLYRDIDKIIILLNKFPQLSISLVSNYVENNEIQDTSNNFTQEFLLDNDITNINNINTEGIYNIGRFILNCTFNKETNMLNKFISINQEYMRNINFVNFAYNDQDDYDLNILLDDHEYADNERYFVSANYNINKILFINGNPVMKITEDNFKLLVKLLKRDIDLFDVVPIKYHNYYTLSTCGGLGGHFVFTTCRSEYIINLFNITTSKEFKDIFDQIITDFDINIFMYKIDYINKEIINISEEDATIKTCTDEIYIPDDIYETLSDPVSEIIKIKFYSKYYKYYIIYRRFKLIDLWRIRYKYPNNKFKEYYQCGECNDYVNIRTKVGKNFKINCIHTNIYPATYISDYPIEFYNLITNGIIEFISCAEVFYDKLSLAIDPTKYDNQIYAEIDPTSFLSFSALTVPFSNKTYGVRLAYQSNMVQQAFCCQPGALHAKTISHGYLLSGQKAICNTEINSILEEDCTAGTNVVVGIALDSKNSEDSFVCSESCSKTLLRYAKYKKDSYKLKSKQNNSNNCDKMGIHPNANISKYKHIDSATGLPILNSYVMPGDIIFAKYKESSINNKIIYTDTSFVADVDHYGVIIKINIVDGIFESGRTINSYDIDITFGNYREYIEGDKICARYAQKQTCGEIVKDNVFPVVTTGPTKGMRIEMLMSAAMYPSRQTSGLTNEFICSLHGAYYGKFVNATPFRDFNSKELFKIKKELMDVRYGEIKYELIRLFKNKDKNNYVFKDCLGDYLNIPTVQTTHLSAEIYNEIYNTINNIKNESEIEDERDRIANMFNITCEYNPLYSIFDKHCTARVNIGGTKFMVPVKCNEDKEYAYSISDNVLIDFATLYDKYFIHKYNSGLKLHPTYMLSTDNDVEYFEIYVGGRFSNMFIGICRILLLRHQARDKIKSLPKDPTHVVLNRFRQVKSGRDGGLRFNKQENNATLAGGAPAISYERYSVLGDGATIEYCSNCGNRISVNTYEHTCKCGAPSYTTNSAYGTIILNHATSQIGISSKFIAEKA